MGMSVTVGVGMDMSVGIIMRLDMGVGGGIWCGCGHGGKEKGEYRYEPCYAKHGCECCHNGEGLEQPNTAAPFGLAHVYGFIHRVSKLNSLWLTSVNFLKMK